MQNEIPGYVGKIGMATIRGGIAQTYGRRSGAKYYRTEAMSGSRTGISVPSRGDFYRRSVSARGQQSGEYPTGGRT